MWRVMITDVLILITTSMVIGAVIGVVVALGRVWGA